MPAASGDQARAVREIVARLALGVALWAYRLGEAYAHEPGILSRRSNGIVPPEQYLRERIEDALGGEWAGHGVQPGMDRFAKRPTMEGDG